MFELWKPHLALFLATLTSFTGTVSLRLASDTSAVPLAIIGATLWGASAAGFVWASAKGADLGTASALMSVGGLLAINVVGMIWWGDTTEPRKFLALALIIIAIALLASPSAKA